LRNFSGHTLNGEKKNKNLGDHFQISRPKEKSGLDKRNTGLKSSYDSTLSFV